MKTIILGSGPTKDLEMVRNFEGTKIICDKEYHACANAGIKVDYVVNLEDGDLSTYFIPPHIEPKPVVITSMRSNIYTRERIGKEGFLEQMYPHPMINVCYNVGLMAWIFAWEKLKSEDITLTGFDHLYPDKGYDIEHHMWRQMFHDLQEWVPDHVKTRIPKEHQMNYNIQKKKDAMERLQLRMDNPGFDSDGINDYIRYRRDMNDKFIRRFKHWDDDRMG